MHKYRRLLLAPNIQQFLLECAHVYSTLLRRLAFNHVSKWLTYCHIANIPVKGQIKTYVKGQQHDILVCITVTSQTHHCMCWTKHCICRNWRKELITPSVTCSSDKCDNWMMHNSHAVVSYMISMMALIPAIPEAIAMYSNDRTAHMAATVQVNKEFMKPNGHNNINCSTPQTCIKSSCQPHVH